MEYKLGARGLRSIMETLMMQLQYESPSTRKAGERIVITREYAQQQLENSILQEASSVS
jgi:ATP-dependent Clp protease ATP-binding subunit ClpX